MWALSFNLFDHNLNINYLEVICVTLHLSWANAYVYANDNGWLFTAKWNHGVNCSLKQKFDFKQVSQS